MGSAGLGEAAHPLGSPCPLKIPLAACCTPKSTCWVDRWLLTQTVSSPSLVSGSPISQQQHPVIWQQNWGGSPGVWGLFSCGLPYSGWLERLPPSAVGGERSSRLGPQGHPSTTGSPFSQGLFTPTLWPLAPCSRCVGPRKGYFVGGEGVGGVGRR